MPGAGKSTFINYLYGCLLAKVTLVFRDGRKVKGAFVVDEESSVASAMEIGHTNQSCTFFPALLKLTADYGSRVAIDCPGFGDSRGAEISIANAVNIKAAIARSVGACLILLVNYYSLAADRGRGIREVAELLLGLFGTADRVLRSAESILIVVSKVRL